MSNIKTGDILNFDYTSTVQTVTLPKGTISWSVGVLKEDTVLLIQE